METQYCNGCKCDHPVDYFAFRNKAKGVRHVQCRTYQSRLASKRRYVYPDIKKCNDCSKKLPIAEFFFKSKATGQREAICGVCSQARRDPEKRSATRKKWYYDGDGKKWVKKYNHNYKKRRNELHKERCKTDISYKIKCNVRTRIYGSLKANGLRRNGKIKYLGMNKYYYKKWLEYQFDENMNWNNYGSYWEIDHIVAIDSFKFTDEDDGEIYTCFDWKNTRPLEAGENARKSNIIDKDIIEKHVDVVEGFIWSMLEKTGETKDNERYSYYTEKLYDFIGVECIKK